MQRKDYIFWVALPPAVDDLRLLEEATALAEPLLDLRYGSASYKRSILKKAVQCGLSGLTVFADCRDNDLNSFLLKALAGDSRIILAAAKQGSANIEPLLNEFRKRNIVTGIEVDNRADAQQAVTAGADFLVASGNEAYGPVSIKTSLILIQELLEGLNIPLVIRGSLGPQGAAGALAAGCSGCILDSQLLLLDQSPLSDELKKDLRKVSPSDTMVLGALVDYPYRFLGQATQEQYRTLLAQERKVFLENSSAEEKKGFFEEALRPVMLQGFSEGAVILPVGQGITFAQQFAEKGLGIKEVLKVYHSALSDSIVRVKTDFPFLPKSALAQYHKVKYPLVQGPMACVTDNPRLAKEVAKAGALPFVAVAGLSPQESRRLLSETRSALAGQPFGVGIIDFSPFEKISQQIEAVLAEHPDFITVAGGDSSLTRRFEQAGIDSYIHAPTLMHLRNFLDAQVRGIILEGHEAGGHIGALGSLVLWELGVKELMRRNADTVSSTRLLLAGGIANARGALAAAVLVSPLLDQEVAVGLQIGTAYLMTDEAVTSGAIPVRYQKMLLNGDKTATFGQTVNLPARWLLTPAIQKMIETEFKLEERNLPLPERKKQIEELNINHLRRVLSDKEKKLKKTQEQDLSASDTYICGQMVTLQRQSRQIVELHQELTQKAQQLAESCPIPEAAWEIPDDAIAIIGMGGIFPDANNLREYWKNIISGHCAIRQVPKERWDPDLYYHPDGAKLYKSYSRIGAFIDGFKKDPLKFRIPPVSAPFIDRIQFLMLEATHQALEDAGYLGRKFPRERTAVFVGGSGHGEMGVLYHVRAHWGRFAKSLESVKEFRELPQEIKNSIFIEAEKTFSQGMPELSEDSCGGVFGSIVAGRINNCFNLGGTSVVLDAACASSLAAVDIGVRGLREKRFDLVLAGAVDGRLDPGTYILFSSLGAISARGCFPFDERADGFVLGEGAGAILLKRLDDAICDGDKIYAVIRSIGTSADGRAKGITAPDVNGQIRDLERTYEKVPFGPETISFIEAHGTGTWLGDTAEITSLTKFLRRYSDRKRIIGLGTVKSMIGHLRGAAGMAGIIKVAQALHNQTLPPTINSEQPRKDVDWENSPFYLITESRPWKGGYLPRRAAVDSFGFGGINFHLILEQAPPKAAPLVKVASDAEAGAEFPAELLVFRTSTRRQLLKLIEDTKNELIRTGQSDLRKIALNLMDIAFSTGPTLTVVAADADELISHLNKAQEVLSDESRLEFSSAQGIYFSQSPLGSDEKVAFLFPGQSAQYLNMGGDLPSYFPFIAEIFRKVDSISDQYIGTSMLPMLISGKENSPEEKSRLSNLLVRPDYNHPAMLAMGMGILEALARAGVRPDMVAGHSLGEYLALYAAGVFDMQTAIEVTTLRGSGIVMHCFQNGTMASIGASAEMVQGILEGASGFVAVANKNCPAQTVISGEVEAIEDVIARLEKEDIPCQQLSISNAFHTPLLAACVEPFRGFLNRFTVNPPRVPIQSNLTGRAYKVDQNFTSHLRESLVKQLIQPVEFINNILSLYEDGARLFVEVGPRSTLSSFVDNILTDKPHWSVATNLPRRSATLQLLHALAFCAARGLPVNVSGIMPTPRRALRRTAPAAVAKPRRPAVVKKSPTPSMPSLIGEALKDQNADLVQRYLAQRNDFLKDMLRLDFQHFTGMAEKEVAEKRPADDELEKRVVAVISRKTGYPANVIDIELDMEAELGLDSIKQVEIIREVAQELDIDFGGDFRSQRYRMTTPRKLIEACRNLISKKPAIKQPEPSKQGSQVQIPKKDWYTDCHRWVSEKVEIPLAGKNNPEALKGSHVLLLAGADGPGSLLRSRLEQAGALVSTFSLSEGIENLPDDFDLILNLWFYTEDDIPTLDSIEQWWKQTAQQATAILKVGQKLAHSIRQNKDKRALWVEVTSLGAELGARAIDRVPARAGIGLGISRCLLSEFPDRLGGLYLDFDPQEPEVRVADCILDELTHEQRHLEIGYSQGKRFEIRWKMNDWNNEKPRFQLDAQSVVLAIGGSRGITASICHAFAQRSRAQFIIVGRTPVGMGNDAGLKEPVTFETARAALLEQWRAQGKHIVPAELDQLAWKRVWESERSWNMKRLDRLAGKVIYRQCDITNIKGVRRLISEVKREYGRIDLVLQGGGDVIEKSTEDIDANEFTETMKSKALGTACLLAALSDVQIGALVNLSSISGRWGFQGLSSYAAGHEIAAILVAGTRKKRAGRWINIFYGPWLNMGMTRTGFTMERLLESKSHFVTEDAGSEFFIKEFESGPSHNVGFLGKKSFGVFPGSDKGSRESPSLTPLLEHIDIVAPGVAEGGKVFDLKRDRFVAEHYVFYEDPIMPAVVSLEMIAQTASVLIPPGLSVTDIVDLTFPRPGIFPRGEPRKFYTRVRLLSKEKEGIWFAGEVFSLFTPPASRQHQELLHARCKMRFGHREPPQKPALLLVSTGLGDCRLQAKSLWNSQARQGRQGMFRTIHSFSSVTRDGVVGEVLATQVRGFGERPWLNNPMRLDGLADLVNLSMDVFHGNESSLAAGIKSIKFFASDDPEAIRFCRTRIRQITKSDFIYDVEAMDSMGRAVERISGIQKPMEVSNLIDLSMPHWEPLLENPRQKEIRHLLNYDDKLVLAQVPISLVQGALEADEGQLLHEQLTAEEIKKYRSLQYPKRRLDWLAGRIVAKGAVRIYLDTDTPFPSAITVRSLPNNLPYIVIDGAEVTASLPNISISHSSDMAVAVAAQSPGVGIDVEKIAESILEIADEFSTDEELELVLACSAFMKLIALTGIWVMKEASRKAAGCEACSMKELILEKAQAHGDYVICELYHLNTGHIKSVAFQSNEYIYAVSILLDR